MKTHTCLSSASLQVSIGCPEKMEPITKVSHIPASRWALSCSLCREHTGTCIQVRLRQVDLRRSPQTKPSEQNHSSCSPTHSTEPPGSIISATQLYTLVDVFEPSSSLMCPPPTPHPNTATLTHFTAIRMRTSQQQKCPRGEPSSWSVNRSVNII